MAVNYYLAPHKNKAGEQPIRISINIYKTWLLSTVGINVLADAWEGESQAVKIKIKNDKDKLVKYENSKSLDAAFINKKLTNNRDNFDNYEKELTHRPSEKELRLELDNALSEDVVVQPSENVLKYFNQFYKGREHIQPVDDRNNGMLECVPEASGRSGKEHAVRPLQQRWYQRLRPLPARKGRDGMDAYSDYQFLMSNAGKRSIVNLHVEGIIDYLRFAK